MKMRRNVAFKNRLEHLVHISKGSPSAIWYKKVTSYSQPPISKLHHAKMQSSLTDYVLDIDATGKSENENPENANTDTQNLYCIISKSAQSFKK